MFYLISIGVVALDMITKHIIASNIAPNDTVYFIKGFFDITYVQNTGAAFGIFEGKQIFLEVVTIAMIVAMTIYAISQMKKSPKLETIAFALVISGGLGNLISRMMDGYVVDFFNFYFWPVFNVADIAICVGCGLLILSILILEPLHEKKNKE